MATQLPDPKVIIDSVADGIVEAAEGPARVAKNVASVAETFATEVKSNMDTVKAQLPDNPAVLPEVAIKAAGQTVKAGLDLVDGVAKGAMETFDAVRKQIQRVTG